MTIANKKKIPQSYVLGFAFDYAHGGTRVALILKSKPDFQRNQFNGIGGHMESYDASPVAAMVREFHEETNKKTQPVDWHQFGILEREGVWIVFLYAAQLDSLNDARTSTSEPIIIHDMKNLPWNTLYNVRWLIPMARARLCGREEQYHVYEN